VDIRDIVAEDGVDKGEEENENGEIETSIPERRPTKREKLEKKRKIEEYLDEHMPFNVTSLPILF
jgi:hypothetical protein